MTKPASKALVALAAFLVVFFGAVGVKTQLVRTGYQITELKARLRVLELELAQAEVRLAGLKSVPAAQARAQLSKYALPHEYPPGNIRYLKNK